jgi:DNA-binding MarR family transcriptional regulator
MGISLDNSIGYALTTTLNLLRKEFNAQISSFQLSSEQFAVLKLLDEIGPMTPTKISNILQRDKATITRIINSLEKKGFITKQKVDNRSFEISITSKGYKEYKKADEIAQKFHEKIRTLISDDEYFMLLETLKKIRKGFI